MRAYAAACVRIVQKLAPISRMPAITLTNIYLGERLGGEGITQNRTSSQVGNCLTKLFSGEPPIETLNGRREKVTCSQGIDDECIHSHPLKYHCGLSKMLDINLHKIWLN